MTAKVLLVEDSPSDAHLIQHGLRQGRGARYEVMVAERLDTAMAKLREQKFDVVLLDLGLPDSTGLATFTRVQTEFPGLPIVIMTGADDETTGAEAIRQGAQDYLIKGSADARSVASAIRYAIERKQIEEKLRELNQSLEQRVVERTAEVRQQADQLRALATELTQAEQRERKRLSTILHDHIQQLLVAARMQVEWLKRDNNPDRRQAAAKGLDGILKEALEASRSLAVELSPPVLHTAGLIGALNWLASRTQQTNQFAVHLHADNKAEPATEATRFLLFECVRELLLNAVKHSGVLEAQVMLLRTKDDRIKLIVRDQGKGFDPDLLKKRRADEISFGLFSIEQRLAHIGGEMYIATAPGKGTTITLTIPVGAAQPHARIGDETAGTEEQAGKIIVRDKTAVRHVLIVDDHKIMREGLAGIIQFEPDIEVVGQAADGPVAVELAAKLQPDVIIMDINLGAGMNGVEATKRILAASPNIKVIGLSMHTDNDVATALRDAGAVAYLTKGGPSEDLIAAIRLHASGVPDHQGASENPAAGATGRPEHIRQTAGTARINTATDALVLEDVQRDFCPGGALPVPRGDEVVPPLNQWLRVKKLFRVATRDWHPADHCSFKRSGGPWPDHCVQNTPGADFHPDLNTRAIDLVVSKATDPAKEAYSAFDAPELPAALKARGIRRLWIGGLATEYCVKATVLDARKLGFDVFVIEDAIRGIEVKPGDIAAAREEMARAGAVFVQTGEVLGRKGSAP